MKWFKLSVNLRQQKAQEVITVCARIEEVAELDDEEKAEFLAELGIKESGLDQLIRKAYIA